jgi:hypothetical protein
MSFSHSFKLVNSCAASLEGCLDNQRQLIDSLTSLDLLSAVEGEADVPAVHDIPAATEASQPWDGEHDFIGQSLLSGTGGFSLDESAGSTEQLEDELDWLVPSGFLSPMSRANVPAGTGQQMNHGSSVQLEWSSCIPEAVSGKETLETVGEIGDLVQLDL